MKIRNMTASFGMLANSSIHFHDGLNIIYSPNESGKSTWCAFILAMLYGVDTTARARTGALPDKQKYAPWSGAPMEGTMDLVADKCDITLQRTTRLKNAPMREFTAVYTGSNVPVEGMTGANAGKQLTGVSRDVFCRSAFIGQGNVAVTESPELEKRISAIVSSGEEATSYSEADKRLRVWRHKRRYNGHGLITEAETEANAVLDELHELECMSEEISTLESQLAGEEQRVADLEKAVSESRRKQRRAALNQLGAARSVSTELGRTHDEALSVLTEARDALRAGPFGMTPLEDVEQQVEKDIARLRRLAKPVSISRLAVFGVLFLLLAVMFAAVGQISTLTVAASTGLLFCAALACFAAICLLMKMGSIRRKNQEAENQRLKLLGRYHADGIRDIQQQLEEHAALWEAVNSAERGERRSREAYETAAIQLETTQQNALEALDFAGGSSDAVQLGKELSEARRRSAGLSSRVSMLRGKLAASGDPVVLRSSLTRILEKKEHLQAEYEAITLAMETLREADTELSSRFAPELSRVTAEYMRILTGGRYSDVFLDKNFSAAARAAGDIVARDSEYLSAGTIDLLYLAVRLAVCELAMPEGETCPLILDDALVNLDAERFQQALKLLGEIAQERQVILFTCREA